MKILKGVCLVLVGLILGMEFAVGVMNSNDTISINGKRVKVVDVMYTYELDNGVVVEGDYSLSVNNGYEYAVDGSYSKEYQNAKLRK